MLKAFKSQKGMTIVELLVTLTISVIILSSLVFLFATGLNLYAKASDTYSAHTMALFTQQKIEAEISYAGVMQIDIVKPSAFTVTGNNPECLYVSNGRLADAVPNETGGLKDQYVYLSGAYSGLSCSITYKLSSLTVLEVDITVYKGSITNVLYAIQTDIVVNNVDPGITGGSGIADATSGVGAALEFINPTVSS